MSNEWSKEQDDYLEKFYLLKTDEELAEILNHTPIQIAIRRKKFGFKKNSSKVICKDGYKWCSKCSRELPFESFHKNKSRPGGLQAVCIECDKKYKEEKRMKDKYGILEKPCDCCGNILSVKKFKKDKNSKDGYKNICKECEMGRK